MRCMFIAKPSLRIPFPPPPFSSESFFSPRMLCPGTNSFTSILSETFTGFASLGSAGSLLRRICTVSAVARLFGAVSPLIQI